jgi:hypothetical protein
MGLIDMAHRVAVPRVDHLRELLEGKLVAILDQLAAFSMRAQVDVVYVAAAHQVDLRGLTKLHVIMVVREVGLVRLLGHRQWLVSLSVVNE